LFSFLLFKNIKIKIYITIVLHVVRFGVLTAVVRKISLFWDKHRVVCGKICDFWRSMSPPSSDMKNKSSKKPTRWG
jgi:hypothetical protein